MGIKGQHFYKGKADQMDMLLFGNNFLDYFEHKINRQQFAENIGVSVPTLNKHMNYWIEKLYLEMQLGLLTPVTLDKDGNKIIDEKPTEDKPDNN